MRKKHMSFEELVKEGIVLEEDQPYETPLNWIWVKLNTINKNINRNIEPSKFRDETFELYSVPSFSENSPEIVKGEDIGSSKQLVNYNDVLLCKINPRINRVWKVTNNKGQYRQLASTEWIVISENSKIYTDYLLSYFKSPYFRRLISSNVSGVGGSLTRARPKEVENYLIPIPPFNEQKRIAEKIESLLSKIQEARQLIDEANETSEFRRAAILDKAFRGELTSGWRESNLNENKDAVEQSAGPYKLPNGWKWRKLSELGKLERGKSKHRPRNDERLFGGDYPFIQTGDVAKAEDYIENFSQTLSEFGLNQSKLFPIGTVCITIAANIADTAILKFPCCFPDSVVGFIPDEGSVSSEFIHYYISTIKNDLEHYAPATAQKNINLKILNEVLVPVPSVQEHDILINTVKELLGRHDNASELITIENNIESLKQSILSKAFRGELGTNEPSEESAIELLKEVLQEQ